MQRLKASAQEQIKTRQAYQGALNNAKTALGRDDYTNAAAWAAGALQIIPRDPAATAMRDEAQKAIDNYHSAVDKANEAYRNGDFAAAETEADNALAIYKDDPTMQRLKVEARAQLKIQEAYRVAMKNAKIAYDNRDYTNAMAWAATASEKIPGDAAAAKLHETARKLIDEYNEAVNQSRAAYQRGDYPTAINIADTALSVYKEDPVLQGLKANAVAQNKILEEYRMAVKNAQAAYDNHDYAGVVTWSGTALLKIPGDATATQLQEKAQAMLTEHNEAVELAEAAYQRHDYPEAVASADKALAIQKDDATMTGLKGEILRQLDEDFVNLLDSFNISVPSGIRQPGPKRASTLGAIGDAGKPYYQAKVDSLEKAYRSGNWLGENNRQTALQKLREAINIWE
jgi:tetratricopeptide (TPR) repeat protein